MPDGDTEPALRGTVAAAATLLLGGVGGAPGLAALAVGTLLLDICMQSGHIANHVRIFALAPEARSRLNTAYMTCAYAGGGLGSWLSATIYARVGWAGVCLLAATLAAVAGLALARHLLSGHLQAGPAVGGVSTAIRPVSRQSPSR